MIKFFRRIRQRLLSENKFRKYLSYAVGEIILVVIGILIALQINNWNENQKAKLYERKMLFEIVEDLRIDSTSFQVQFRRIKSFEKSIDKLLIDPSLIKNENGDIRLFGGIALNINTKAIETIKSGNIQIPFDDDLRKQINNHYYQVQFFLDILTIEDKDFREFYQAPFGKSHFTFKIDSTSKAFNINTVPISYEALIKSRAYNDYLLIRKSRITRWKNTYERLYASTLKSINSITDYLK